MAEWKLVAKEQGLTLESKCESVLGEIVSGPLKINQIAGNLLSKAMKYRKPKQGGYVGISFSASGKASWKMTVADTGIGIAPEDTAGLFGEFKRIHPTSGVAGTGLGLAICKEFSELLGGSVEVRSEPGQGARFEVTLPISRPLQQHVSPAQSRDGIASSGHASFQPV